VGVNKRLPGSEEPSYSGWTQVVQTAVFRVGNQNNLHV